MVHQLKWRNQSCVVCCVDFVNNKNNLKLFNWVCKMWMICPVKDITLLWGSWPQYWYINKNAGKITFFSRIMLKWISICAGPLWLAVSWYFPAMWSLVYLLLFTLFFLLAVFVLTLWGHIALSSPHQTSLFLIERLDKEVRELDEILKVGAMSYNIFNMFISFPHLFNTWFLWLIFLPCFSILHDSKIKQTKYYRNPVMQKNEF